MEASTKYSSDQSVVSTTAFQLMYGLSNLAPARYYLALAVSYKNTQFQTPTHLEQ